MSDLCSKLFDIPADAKLLKSMPARYPINGTFELTVRCNMHCKMCLFRHADCENARLLKEELTASQWIDLARQAADAGTVSLLITGGEPLLRPDFCEIWKGIYSFGFILELYTNATLVDEKIMEVLREYPPHSIGVTLYGASAETYRRVCGNGDMFEKAISGMKQLQTLPSKMSFRTTLIRDNYKDIDNIYNLVAREFGPQYRITQTRLVSQSVRGACADVNTCRLDPVENVELAFRRCVVAMKRDFGNRYDPENVHVDTKEHTNVVEERKHISIFGCDGGMKDYCITWDGKLQGCQMFGVFTTDAIGEGLQNAWNRFPYVVELPPIDSKCKQCEYGYACNCCPASRYAETGDMSGIPEYVCKDAEAMHKIISGRNKKWKE